MTEIVTVKKRIKVDSLQFTHSLKKAKTTFKYTASKQPLQFSINLQYTKYT
jgi:hypothetical protein